MTSSRPEIALITNHGYAGPQMPTGGAADTGGQIVYVNDMARALETLGYRVTVFARGGFPEFDRDQLRQGERPLTGHVRYVYVPGGGDMFIRKEDIAIALDEQLDWLDRYVRDEARDRNCRPWEVYEFVNTHYWDAAVLGIGLIERWRNDIAAEAVRDLLEGVVEAGLLENAMANRHWDHLGDSPELQLGQMLIAGNVAISLRQRVAEGASKWTSRWGGDATAITGQVADSIAVVAAETAPAFEPLAAARALGNAVLASNPGIMADLKKRMDRSDHHIWTPHSLSELKDWNFRNRPLDVRRALKFCERRNHERVICQRTPAFAATSVEITARLHTHYRVNLDKIFYFPPCIDTQRYREYDEESREPAYQYLSDISGLTVERLRNSRIVFETGRMDQAKRKDLLLAAFARIADQHDETYLFIGGGPKNDLFQALQQQIDLTDSLRGRAWLTGPIPDEFMGPLFAMADIYATPSEMEGFGMTVSQAAASGTLVISSDVIPFSVYHIPGIVLLVPAGNVVAMAKAIDRALDDEVERREKAIVLAAEIRQLDWVQKSREFIEFLRSRGMDIADGVPTA